MWHIDPRYISKSILVKKALRHILKYRKHIIFVILKKVRQMEINLNIPQEGLNQQELQNMYTEITAKLLYGGAIKNFQIAPFFKGIFIISSGETETFLLAQFLGKYQSTITKYKPQPDFLYLSLA